MYSSNNSGWALSKKGNYWRRVNGILLVVGQRKDGAYWAMRGGNFLNGSYSSLALAKHGAETGSEGLSGSCEEDGGAW